MTFFVSLVHMVQALSKALTEDELIYLRVQFNLLEPTDGCVSLDNFRSVSISHLNWFNLYGDLASICVQFRIRRLLQHLLVSVEYCRLYLEITPMP